MEEEIKMTLPEGEEPALETKVEEPQSKEPEYSEVEQEAMKHGWRPEADFDATKGKKWKTAEAYMELKPLYDKIDEQHRTVKGLKKSLEDFGTHYNKVEQAAYNRAVADLKDQRKVALEEGDLVRAEAIRDEMDELKDKQAAQPVVQVQHNRISEEQMDAWYKRNDWYRKDKDLTAFADGIGNELHRENVDPIEILAEVERRAKGAFPHKFRNPNKDGAPRVESGGNKKGSAGEDTSFMDATEIRIMENLIKSGAPISRADYIKDLKKVKGLK